MWYVTNQKHGVSALGLQRILGLGSYQTAWAWLHKLRRAMVRPGRDLLGGAVEVDPFDRVGRMQLLAVLLGEANVGEDVVLGFVHQGGELGDLGPELVGDLTPLDLRAVGVLLGEGGGDEGGDDAPTLAAGMGQQVAGEVHAASLPGGAEDPGRGGLQALVVVGDHQLHAAQPAPGQRAQELSPEGLGLRRADRHAQDLTPALVVDGHSHGHRDRDDASGLAHLHISRIQPQIGTVALQRSIKEAVDLIVDLAAQPGDLALSANITETPATFGISVGRRR